MNPPAPSPPQTVTLTPQEMRLILALREVREQARGRPWMAIVRGTDGLVLVHDAGPPMRVGGNWERK